MNVFLIAALTADGFIAKDADHLSTKWTSAEDAEFFSTKTKQAGVCIMGATTFRTINRPLPGRLTVVYTREPAEFSQFDQSQVRATSLSPAELIESLAVEGFDQVAICGGSAIYTMFFQAGLVDELFLTHEPVFFGQGVSLFSDSVVGDDLKAQQFKLKEIISLSDQTKVLHYVP